ncbi:MAG: malto-oligosyltrehalose trehalohydrolase [Acidobacteriota bacterium]|nr:malto-oligosyltrehalose trehalohydrolase [Acidobacteriota bacterium]
MVHRRRKIGAEVVSDGVSFRVWAPAHERVSVVIDGQPTAMHREDHGYFSAVIKDAQAGTLYKYRLGDSDFPDPASRFQPEGVHGPSQVIDPAQYRWRDDDWRGIEGKGRVLYEMHVGTFTREGTYDAATEHFAALADVGINTIELMPVSAFAGTFGWGYDGVDLWAPFAPYGTPDDLRAFVDAAHAHGIGVLLDVVYNHLGPDGSYLKEFTPAYTTDKYKNEWGEAINFDCEHSHGVRDFVCENAAHWIDEYHFDGFRIDATQSMLDDTEKHILRELTERAREAANGRSIFIAGENEPQNTKLLREYGLDALWNDDWHHSARVAATGRNEAYYTDYHGHPQEFVSMARHGFLYQGQRYKWQKKRRGTSSRDIAAERLVCYLQNHDQIANSGRGDRIDKLTSPGRLRAITALMLLQPQTPMLFQGQEFASSAPFVFFADHKPELAEKVRKGRREFVEQFPSLKGFDLPLPDERATFEMCKLDHKERETHAPVVALHRDLLSLRREAPFSAQRKDLIEGSVLADECLALRWFAEDERLLIVNFGPSLQLDPAPDPLLAPPPGFERWSILWSSEDARYGGNGMPQPDCEENWRITAHSAVLLKPV